MKRQEIQSFGEAFNGKTPSKEEQRSSGRPILKIRDIDEKGRFRGVFESFVDDAFYNRHAKKKLKTGDTIILNAAHNSDYVGSKNAFVTNELNDVIATGEWLIVRVREANSKYVNHYLKSPSGRKALKNCVKGIHLYPKDVERISVPFPILDDQIRIAHLLGKVEGLIAQRKQHLQQLDDLLKSVFLEMFGDHTTMRRQQHFPFGEFIEFLTSGSRGWAQYYSDSGSIFLRINNVKDARLKLEDIVYVNAPDSAEANRTRVRAGDLLLSITADLGRTAVVPNALDGSYINQHLALIRINIDTGFNPSFLAWYFSLPYGNSFIQKKNREGVKAGLNFDDIRSFPVIKPPIDLQNQFAAIVEKVESLKSRYQQSLTDLKVLYGALSQKAFKGELDLSRVPLV